MDPRPTTATTPPTRDEAARVAATADPVVRNLRITRTYHRLSTAFAERIGTSANWCTFATWASRQAGQTIRGEDLTANLERHLRLPGSLLHPWKTLWRALLRRGLFDPDTRLGRFVRSVHTPFDAFERASDALARGNRKVFAEIGGEFARYLETCPPGDERALRSFLEGFRPGDPPEGQDLLRDAFLHYHRAQAETDPRRRAQLVHLANLKIGLLEQTRIEPEIREAMDAGSDTAEHLGLLPRLAAPLRRFGREVTRRAITECLMVLALPGGTVLSLARPMDSDFPETLRTLDDEELRNLSARLDGTGGSDDAPLDSWAHLAVRMRFISRLFRCCHDRRDLFDTPLTPDEERWSESGDRSPARAS